LFGSPGPLGIASPNESEIFNPSDQMEAAARTVARFGFGPKSALHSIVVVGAVEFCGAATDPMRTS